VRSSELITALIALGVIGTLSTLYGRRYCNTICPVGTFFGLLSRYSRFQVRLKSNCRSCGLCTAACKGECIDAKNKTVDASRCVACFNCISACKRDAIAYSLPLKEDRLQASDFRLQDEVSNANPEARSPQSEAQNATSPRRRFLHWSMFSLLIPTVAGIVAKKAKLVASSDSDATQGEGHTPYEKTQPVIPPGGRSIKRYMSKCTGCHLCVSKCPAGIITPSTFELGLSGFMQPILNFNTRYCDDTCNICTTVCPSHALVPLTNEEKSLTSIGKAVFVRENCVVHTMGENCASCDEHCPTKAIQMVSYDAARNLVIPSVDRELCVGCGACEYACPIRPYRGIYVDGLAEHEPAKPAGDPNAKQEDISETIEFPF
jgi:ferredoxin